MSVSVHINASFGSMKTLNALSEVLKNRMKYMHESARDSVAAVAINVLKSLRTVTRVAKKSSVKVNVVPDSTIAPSFSTKGKVKMFCIRFKGSNLRYVGKETVVNRSGNLKFSSLLCFRFKDEYAKVPKDYIIVCGTKAEASKIAKQIVVRKAMRYAGLAKRAIGILMFKTNTKKVNDGLLNPLIENVADNVTRRRELVSKSEAGGKYALLLDDYLDYALDAIKGGNATVEIQTKKAMNKVVSIINQKIKHGKFLSNEKLPTPFPELVRKRK